MPLRAPNVQLSWATHPVAGLIVQAAHGVDRLSERCDGHATTSGLQRRDLAPFAVAEVQALDRVEVTAPVVAADRVTKGKLPLRQDGSKDENFWSC